METQVAVRPMNAAAISGGRVIQGRRALKAWVAKFFRLMPGAEDEILDVFANAMGDCVVAR